VQFFFFDCFLQFINVSQTAAVYQTVFKLAGAVIEELIDQSIHRSIDKAALALLQISPGLEPRISIPLFICDIFLNDVKPILVCKPKSKFSFRTPGPTNCSWSSFENRFTGS
jgi:hypothetical protein